MRSVLALLFSCLMTVSLFPLETEAAKGSGAYIVYVGTYTKDGSKGIYAYRFEPSKGSLVSIGWVGETANPSFLALHPSNQFLYAVNEISDYQGEKSGSVSAFAVDRRSGKLAPLNTVATRGTGACHLVVDKTGKCVVVANYGSGSVAAFPISKDGKLGEASAFVQHNGSSSGPRQKGPHAHMIQLSANNRFVLVPDLGLDQVITYKLDAEKASLTAGPTPAHGTAGLGPRHMAFDPSSKFDYLINEMGSAVTAFRFDSTSGSLTSFQTVSTLANDFKGVNNSAEIEVHPNGKFVYASNRGDDSIAVFAIKPGDGTLTPAGRVQTKGRTPRNFAIDPTGNYLLAANQDSGNIVTFKIDAKTGALSATGEEMKVPQPVCIVFMPAE